MPFVTPIEKAAKNLLQTYLESKITIMQAEDIKKIKQDFFKRTLPLVEQRINAIRNRTTQTVPVPPTIYSELMLAKNVCDDLVQFFTDFGPHLESEVTALSGKNYSKGEAETVLKDGVQLCTTMKNHFQDLLSVFDNQTSIRSETLFNILVDNKDEAAEVSPLGELYQLLIEQLVMAEKDKLFAQRPKSVFALWNFAYSVISGPVDESQQKLVSVLSTALKTLNRHLKFTLAQKTLGSKIRTQFLFEFAEMVMNDVNSKLEAENLSKDFLSPLLQPIYNKIKQYDQEIIKQKSMQCLKPALELEALADANVAECLKTGLTANDSSPTLLFTPQIPSRPSYVQVIAAKNSIELTKAEVDPVADPDGVKYKKNRNVA